jgi:glycosyltransferase involved in cell wall biosynthesis
MAVKLDPGRSNPPMSFVPRIKSPDLSSLTFFRFILSRLMWWRYRVFGDAGTVQSLATLCRIACISGASSTGFRRRVEHEISKSAQQCKNIQVRWPSVIDSWKPGIIEKAVVLKPYLGEQERGVILVSFEYQWARLMGLERLEDFAMRYTLVAAPTWTPPHCLANTLLPAQYPGDRLFTLISNSLDCETFPRLSPKWRVVPLYASNWVNPDLYRPVPFAKKDIDIVMLANFAPYKRHSSLFRALREIKKDIKVVLIGQPSGGGTAASLRQQARRYGVEDRIEIRESVTNEEVADGLARAKISLILSRQEGSCVAVVESIFANTPVGLFRDAIVGSREFIDPQHTGRLLDHHNLAAQLSDFLEHADRYSPRQSALDEGLCCRGSSATLNRHLKESAIAAGQRWTRDIAVHHWNPDPLILDPADLEDLRADYEEIRARYGMTLGKQILPSQATPIAALQSNTRQERSSE